MIHTCDFKKNIKIQRIKSLLSFSVILFHFPSWREPLLTVLCISFQNISNAFSNFYTRIFSLKWDGMIHYMLLYILLFPDTSVIITIFPCALPAVTCQS